MGIALAHSPRPERWMLAPVALLGALPVAASILPDVMEHGLRATPIPWLSGLAGLAIATAVGVALAFWLRSRAIPVAVLLAAAAFLWGEAAVFPVLDKAASARSLWSSSHPDCAPVLARQLRYGLEYYSGKALPDCGIVDKNAKP
jgi:hypothetical protein